MVNTFDSDKIGFCHQTSLSRGTAGIVVRCQTSFVFSCGLQPRSVYLRARNKQSALALLSSVRETYKETGQMEKILTTHC